MISEAIEYTIQSRDRDWAQLEVECLLPQKVSHLRMNHAFAEHLELGYTECVGAVSGIAADGLVASIISQGKEGWAIDTRTALFPLTISYTVTLRHEEILPASIRDETPHRLPNAVFWTGRAVFLFPDTAQDFVVRILHGNDVRLTVPWKNTGDEESPRYSLTSSKQLTESFFVIGEQTTQNIQCGDSMLHLAVTGKWKQDSSLLIESVVRGFTAIIDLFGGAPASDIFLGLETSLDGSAQGGVCGNSVNSVIPYFDGNVEATRSFWGSFLIHELFHLWNGYAIRPIDSGVDCYWFIEGFTTYYQDILAYRCGWLTEHQLLAALERSLMSYLSCTDPVSIEGASEDKSRYRALIYDGGKLIALAIHGKILRASGGEASLDTLMALLFQKAIRSGESVSFEDIASVIANLSQLPVTEVSNWLGDLLKNTKRFPAPYWIEPFGLEVIQTDDMPNFVALLDQLKISKFRLREQRVLAVLENSSFIAGDSILQINRVPMPSVRSIQHLFREVILPLKAERIEVMVRRGDKSVLLTIPISPEEAGTIRRERDIELRRIDSPSVEQSLLYSRLR